MNNDSRDGSISPESASTPGPATAAELLTAAEEAFDAAEYERAKELLLLVLELPGVQASDYYNLGQVYMAMRDYRAAVDAYSNATGPDPDIYVSRGLAYERLGDPSAAILDYLAALEVSPNDVEALVNLGTLELQQGRLDDAKEHLERAAELDPAANWQYADVLLEQGDKRAAADALRTAISAGEPRANLDLAALEAEAGNHQEAESHYELAIAANATLAKSEYASFLLDSGSIERAYQLASEAVGGGDKWSLEVLGRILSAMGRDAEARRYLHESQQFEEEIENAETPLPNPE